MFWHVGSYLPDQGLNLPTPALEGKVFTTGLPVKSLYYDFHGTKYIFFMWTKRKSSARVPAWISTDCPVLSHAIAWVSVDLTWTLGGGEKPRSCQRRMKPFHQANETCQHQQGPEPDLPGCKDGKAAKRGGGGGRGTGFFTTRITAREGGVWQEAVMKRNKTKIWYNNWQITENWHLDLTCS